MRGNTTSAKKTPWRGYSYLNRMSTNRRHEQMININCVY